MAAILDAIFNYRVTVDCWKVVHPDVASGGLRRNPTIHDNVS